MRRPDRHVAQRMRGYRERQRRALPAPSRLAITCWCEATVVYVPRAVVLACETVSCGADECQAPAA